MIVVCSRVGTWRVTFTGTFPHTPLRTGLDKFTSSCSQVLTCFVWVTVSLSGLLRGISHTPPVFFFPPRSSLSPYQVSRSSRSTGYSDRPAYECDGLRRNLAYRKSHIRLLVTGKVQIFHAGGPGAIRTRGLFSAIDKQVGEKGGNAVYYVYVVPKSPYCSSISVPELFPSCTRSSPDMHHYEARKGNPQTCPNGENKFFRLFYVISKRGAARTLNQ